MAIYIQLNRTEDSDTMSIYEFGPAERKVGSVAISKPSGEVELLQIDEEWASRLDFYLLRIRRVYEKHAQEGRSTQLDVCRRLLGGYLDGCNAPL